MHSRHVNKNLGLCPASSTLVKRAVSNFVFGVLTFYHCNTKTAVLVSVRLCYFKVPEDGTSAPKHARIILCDV